MMDSTRTKTTLNDFKPASRTQDHIGSWDAHIVKDNLTMTMGSIIETKD